MYSYIFLLHTAYYLSIFLNTQYIYVFISVNMISIKNGKVIRTLS